MSGCCVRSGPPWALAALLGNGPNPGDLPSSEPVPEPWAQLRLLWLQGDLATAERFYLETKEGFIVHRMGYDAAMVSLDLAILYLQTGRLADVQQLAEEMIAIFQAQDVNREALAALHLFQEAARRQELTVEKVRELATCLCRTAADQLSRPVSIPPSRPAG